jgi:hypothetical protein
MESAASPQISMSWSHVRSMARQMIPAFVLPATLYFSLSPHVGVLLALMVAASVPVFDSLIRILRGRAQNGMALMFLPMTAIGVGLAALLHSPVFILAKGGVTTVLMGLAFGFSAIVGRPLTRTMALHLSSDHHEARRRLAERWHHPMTTSVFCVLAVAWGVFMLAMGGQQIFLAISASPGLVMLVEPPVHAVGTILGIVCSVLYVRRVQRLHPEIALLPSRADA